MSFENPLSILYNTVGNELAVSASQILTSSGEQPGILIAGSSSNGVVQFMKVADDGAVFITGSVNASATLSPNTPVSQGLPGGIPDSWYIRITDGTKVIGTGSSAPVWISGSVTTNGPSGFQSDPIWMTGSVTTTFDPSTSATVNPITSSTTVVTLQAANGLRRAWTVYNDSSKNLFLKLGTGASVSSFSVKISARGYYEVPGNYTGDITGLWDGVNGTAYVTEILD